MISFAKDEFFQEKSSVFERENRNLHKTLQTPICPKTNPTCRWHISLFYSKGKIFLKKKQFLDQKNLAAGFVILQNNRCFRERKNPQNLTF